MSLNDVMKAHADAFRSKTGVTSKLSITTMTKLLTSLSWKLKENLLTGTSDQYRFVNEEGWAISPYSPIPVSNDQIGKTYTYAVTVKNGNDNKVRLVTYCLGDITSTHKIKVNLGTEIGLGEEKDVSLALPVLEGTKYLRVDVEAINNDHERVRYSYKNERLYEGTEPGVWTPNPADIVGGVTSTLYLLLLPSLEVIA